MFNLLFVPIALLYTLVVGALFIYGLNFFYMTYLVIRKKGEYPAPPPPDRWPSVTVQLPIYNELYVSERLIEAVVNLDYPREQLEIQVLDDSTDETVQIVKQAVENARRQGTNIVLIHREKRTGFKAGALAEGYAQARSEFVAIFDSDFIQVRQIGSGRSAPGTGGGVIL